MFITFKKNPRKYFAHHKSLFKFAVFKITCGRDIEALPHKWEGIFYARFFMDYDI